MFLKDPYQHWLPGTEQNDAFWAGYTEGLNWPAHWKHTPGGPYIYKDQTSKECHLSWLEGWRQGKEQQCI